MRGAAVKEGPAQCRAGGVQPAGAASEGFGENPRSVRKSTAPSWWAPALPLCSAPTALVPSVAPSVWIYPPASTPSLCCRSTQRAPGRPQPQLAAPAMQRGKCSLKAVMWWMTAVVHPSHADTQYKQTALSPIPAPEPSAPGLAPAVGMEAPRALSKLPNRTEDFLLTRGDHAHTHTSPSHPGSPGEHPAPTRPIPIRLTEFLEAPSFLALSHGRAGWRLQGPGGTSL